MDWRAEKSKSTIHIKRLRCSLWYAFIVTDKREETALYEWNEAIQKMICWIEDRLTDNPSLQEMSAQIGYCL